MQRTTISAPKYPEHRPLVLGKADGSDVLLAVTGAPYRGMRAGTELWVTGDGVEAAVQSRAIELTGSSPKPKPKAEPKPEPEAKAEPKPEPAAEKPEPKPAPAAKKARPLRKPKET